ncbi:hypothetical protein [Streptomyces sp. NPDC054866]
MRSEDDHLSDLEFLDGEDEALVAQLTEAGFLTHPGAIVRAGAVPGWTYALESFSSRSRYHLEALSRGTRAYTVFRSGAGMQRVGHARDGQVLSDYEPREPTPGVIATEEQIPGFTYTGEELPTPAFADGFA